MFFKNSLRLAVLSTFLLALTGLAAAQGPTSNVRTTTSALQMGTTVQTAVQLNISTGDGGAAVDGTDAATGAFVLEFGAVNGLGLGTPTSGITRTVDATGATYSTPINLTPVYSGFTVETAAVTVEAGITGNESMTREGASAGTMVPVTTAVSAFSGAASGSNNTRYVGFRINRTEAEGSKEATLIYTVTVQ